MSEAQVIAGLESGLASDVERLASGARVVRSQWANLFEKYSGDVPTSLAYVRCWHETRGRSLATSSQNEKGLLQLFDADSKRYGIDPYVAADNVWAGMQMWNSRSARLFRDRAKYFDSPDPDFWACANMTMSIGFGGTKSLIAAAGGGHSCIVRFIREDTSRFIATVDGWYRGKTSRQSARLVANRVGDVAAWLSAAAELGAVSSAGFGRQVTKGGAPVVVPAVLLVLLCGVLL